MKKIIYLLPLLFAMLVACGVQATPTQNSASVTITAAITITPAARTCSTEAADLILFTNDKDGYCLLYPAENTIVPPHMIVINPTNLPGDIPGDAWMDIIVEAAAERSAAQAADSQIAAAGTGFNITRSEILVDGVQAIVVDGLPGPDPWRIVFVVSNNHLYTLHFSPWAPNTDSYAALEKLYSTVMETIHFLP